MKHAVDIVITTGIITLGLLSIYFHKSERSMDPAAYYCVEGHKFVQSREVEAVLPVYGENDLPVKCSGEGLIEHDN